jgi:hypothetical protein
MTPVLSSRPQVGLHIKGRPKPRAAATAGTRHSTRLPSCGWTFQSDGKPPRPHRVDVPAAASDADLLPRSPYSGTRGRPSTSPGRRRLGHVASGSGRRTQGRRCFQVADHSSRMCSTAAGGWPDWGRLRALSSAIRRQGPGSKKTRAAMRSSPRNEAWLPSGPGSDRNDLVWRAGSSVNAWRLMRTNAVGSR